MQHYRMTLSEAIDHYRKGWIAATALLYYYLKIRLKKGWKVTLHQREITKQLGIPKSSFYRAIENLSKEGLINWEAPNGLVVELADDNEIDEDEETPPLNDSQQDEPIESHEWDLNPTDGTGSLTDGTGSLTDGTGSLTDGTGSLTDGTKTPDKPSPSVDSSNSPTSYQFFINSLSESERENFFIFVKKQIKNLTQPINDLEAWLAHPNKAGQNRWEVYYQNFNASRLSKSKDPNPRSITNSSQKASIAHQERIEQQRQAAILQWEKDRADRVPPPDPKEIFAKYEQKQRERLAKSLQISLEDETLLKESLRAPKEESEREADND